MSGMKLNILGMQTTMPVDAGDAGTIITSRGGVSEWSSAALQAIDRNATSDEMSLAGSSVLIAGDASKQYIIRNMWINYTGTSFTVGDRDVSITDGSITWTTIPAATLTSLVNAQWGTALVMPFPAGEAINALSTPGSDVSALYTGGTTDYSTGFLSLSILYETVAVGP